MATRIDTVASRDKLKPRREPYWHRLRRGCYLGYRRMTSDGAGVWIARARDEASGPTKQIYESLDDFSARLHEVHQDVREHLRVDAQVTLVDQVGVMAAHHVDDRFGHLRQNRRCLLPPASHQQRDRAP